MSLNKEFIQLIQSEVKNHQNDQNDLFFLRECLIRFKDKGMDKDSMLENLQRLRGISDSRTEDILLELMDFIDGYCNRNLSIYDNI